MLVRTSQGCTNAVVLILFTTAGTTTATRVNYGRLAGDNVVGANSKPAGAATTTSTTVTTTWTSVSTNATTTSPTVSTGSKKLRHVHFVLIGLSGIAVGGAWSLAAGQISYKPLVLIMLSAVFIVGTVFHDDIKSDIKSSNAPDAPTTGNSPDAPVSKYKPVPDHSPDVRFLEQEDAMFAVGAELGLYFVGSSNAAWQTWPDQVHHMLDDLGYQTPPIAASHPDVSMHPSHALVCDDSSELDVLETPRIGKVGWSSWGFAFENKDDCDEEGFRDIVGHRVGCTNAWACNPDWCCGNGTMPLIRPSEIADDAAKSQLTVLSNWMNDGRQNRAENVCFDGEDIDPVATPEITVHNLKVLIRGIHQRNPAVVIVVLALYPDMDAYHHDGTVDESSLPRVAAINHAVAEGLADEPNTIFVDYALPLGVDVFQTESFCKGACRLPWGQGVRNGHH